MDGYFSPDLYDKYGHEYTSYGAESYIAIKREFDEYNKGL